MSGSLRLPNGSVTESMHEFEMCWRTLADPIEKATGWKLYAFDPGLSFSDPENYRVVSLPIDFAKALGHALNSKVPAYNDSVGDPDCGETSKPSEE